MEMPPQPAATRKPVILFELWWLRWYGGTSLGDDIGYTLSEMAAWFSASVPPDPPANPFPPPEPPPPPPTPANPTEVLTIIAWLYDDASSVERPRFANTSSIYENWCQNGPFSTT